MRARVYKDCRIGGGPSLGCAKNHLRWIARNESAGMKLLWLLAILALPWFRQPRWHSGLPHRGESPPTRDLAGSWTFAHSDSDGEIEFTVKISERANQPRRCFTTVRLCLVGLAEGRRHTIPSVRNHTVERKNPSQANPGERPASFVSPSRKKNSKMLTCASISAYGLDVRPGIYYARLRNF